MFTTIEETSRLTGHDVSNVLLQQAQAIIESYVGKLEAEVDDPVDRALLGRATAYQAAYMQHNSVTVFQQVPVSSEAFAGTSFTLADRSSPYIAGLARMACEGLSWRRARSVHTGPLFDRAAAQDWRQD